ncbi:hypothetical protein C8Q75DRAFT_116468 [Abortiporus biennis]|nr:hypothetical protein C8Q75DRAFT_116468 [Abortiporus biennis]
MTFAYGPGNTLAASPPGFVKGNGASYIRVASIAIAAYDYILTLPAEYRFYKGQKSWNLNPGCILFILIRYISIITLVISNVGFFGIFSAAECSKYYIAAPIFKVLQTMVSQIILGIRVYNISRRSKWVMWSFSLLYVLITSMEWFTNLWDRLPVQNASNNCTPANSVAHLSVWLYYVLAMTYDVITIAVSTYFLMRWRSDFKELNGLVRVMFYDGLGYFLVLTGANIFNLILYRAADESYQSSGASVGYTVTWIMSQRILIHLRDAAAEHQVHQVMTRQLQSARDVARAMRSQFEGVPSHTKNRLADEYNLASPTREPKQDSVSDVDHGDIPLDVQVQIEHTVTVDRYDKVDHERYRKKSRWAV